MNQNMQVFIDKMTVDKRNYSSARYEMFFVIALTVLNIFMNIFGGSTYMLFSVYIPYSLVDTGLLMTGRWPEEAYLEYAEMMGEPYPIADDTVLYFAIAFAVIVLAVYLVLTVLSNKYYGCLIAATALFGIDTLLILPNITSGMASDAVFHVIILVLLVRGCIAGKRYFAAEKYLAYMQSQNTGEYQGNYQNSPYGDFQGYQTPENIYFQNDQSYQNPPDNQNQNDNGEDKE